MTTKRALLLLLIIACCIIFFTGQSWILIHFHQDVTPTTANVITDSGRCVCAGTDIKIFNIGFPKTGTGTLHDLLGQMGCHSVHWSVSPLDVQFRRISALNSTLAQYRFVGTTMEVAKRHHKPLLHYFRETTNAFTEMNVCLGQICFWPNLIDYPLLNEQYPNALFILMYRNISSHLTSITHFQYLRSMLIEHEIPFLPKGIGQTDEQITKWIQGHYHRVTQYFSKFPSDRFIKFDIEHDDVIKLQHFLHCYGNYTMPHTHKTVNMQFTVSKQRY
eukprot:1038918_1